MYTRKPSALQAPSRPPARLPSTHPGHWRALPLTDGEPNTTMVTRPDGSVRVFTDRTGLTRVRGAEAIELAEAQIGALADDAQRDTHGLESVELAEAAARTLGKLQGHLHRDRSLRPTARRLERQLVAHQQRLALGAALEQPSAPGESATPSSASSLPYRSENNARLAERWRKAGLPDAIFRASPAFVDAVFATHLHQYLRYFGHELTADPKTQEPSLRVEGALVPWRELDARFTFTDGVVRQRSDGQVFSYFEEGLVPWNPERWTSMRPLKVLPPGERPEKHTLEIVSRAHGMHAWIRLTNPKGEVYSVGMLDELHGPEPYTNIARSRHGVFKCPDVYEFLEHAPLRAAIPLEAQVYERIFERVEKLNELGVHFNWVSQNCNTFAAQMANMAGEHIDLKTNLSRMLVPSSIRSAFSKDTKRAIGKAADVIGMAGMNQLLNTLLLLLGGGRGARPLGAPPDAPELGALIGSAADFHCTNQLQIQWPGALRRWQRKRAAEEAEARAAQAASRAPAPVEDR